MNWAEVKTRGTAYAEQAELRRRQSQEEEAEKAKDRDSIIKQSKKLRTDSLFKQLGVEEALTAIRDEVWGEGEVKPVLHKVWESGQGDSEEYGLGLYSDSHNEVYSHGTVRFKHFSAYLYEKIEELVVYTSFKDLGGNSERTYINVKERDWRPISSFSEPLNLRNIILEKGLEEAIYALVRATGGNSDSGYKAILANENWDSTAQDGFYSMLNLAVEKRVKENSLPKQLRAFHEGIVDQFPPQLREQRSMDFQSLHNWEHEIRGANRFHKLVDQLRGIPA